MTIATETRHQIAAPLEAYRRLCGDAPASFLLESAEHGRLGRYSFLGCGSRLLSLTELEASGEPAVGYLAYDHAAALEPSVPLPAAGDGLPESVFVVPDLLVRFDHERGTVDVLRGDEDEVARRLERPAPEERPRLSRSRTHVETSRRDYLRGVVTAKEHIRAGDVFQLVLSLHGRRATRATPLQLYRALRRVNPSPYLFLLELPDLALVGSSPETLVKAEGRRASVNPIAGTTPRGHGDAARLLESAKDRAEHVMLVDLGRNDLARVCVPGTVRVERFLEVERFSHVSHLVSEVVGKLRSGVTSFDLLRACFPAGTVSGAPKVRAMQLISELEAYRRGPYAGAVGYALPDGAFDTCIAIRTLVLARGVARLQAGAGIVADSDPAAEYRECLSKLAALEAAMDLAEASA